LENFTSISDRIRQIIDYKGVSVNKFSDLIGASNSYFNKVLKNNTSVGSDRIEKILREIPEINPEWLLTGRGNMLKEVVDSKGINSNIKDSFNNIKDFNTRIYNKSTVGKEEIPDIKDQLLEKDKQLAEKDMQINNLLERLTESQTQVTTLLEQQGKLMDQQSKLISKL